MPQHINTAAYVLIDAGSNRGSGTLVARRGSRGLVITNNHVAGMVSSAGVTFQGHGSAPLRIVGQVVGKSRPNDYALVIVDGVPSSASPSGIDRSIPQRGDTLYHGGFPGGRLQLRMTRGRMIGRYALANRIGPSAARNQFSVSGGSMGGQSGGGVLNERGQCVGFLWGTSRGSTYAISVECLFDRYCVPRNNNGGSQSDALVAALLTWALQQNRPSIQPVPQQPTIPQTVPIQPGPRIAESGRDLEARAAIESIKAQLDVLRSSQSRFESLLDDNRQSIDDIRSQVAELAGEVKGLAEGQDDIRDQVREIAGQTELLGDGQRVIAGTLKTLTDGQGAIITNQSKLASVVEALNAKQRSDYAALLDVMRQLEARTNQQR